MALQPYKKPYATANEIIGLLQNRGLIVHDSATAAKTIDAMGYTRLRVYLESRCDVRSEGRPFRNGTTFQDILQIYECDAHLRLACFEAVGKFEILFRNNISETLSKKAGSHPQYRKNIFRSQWHEDRVLDIFTKTYNYQVKRDGLAKEYNENYSKPDLPPIWYMKEMLTFGDTSELYGCLNTQIGTEIAKNFGVIDQYFFKNWIYAFVDLRNVCAHHDRLFNRTFQKDLRILRVKKRKIPSAEARVDKLAGLLECLDYVTGKRGSPVNIGDEVVSILSDYPEVKFTEIGYKKTKSL